MLACEGLQVARGAFCLGPIDVRATDGRMVALVGPNASGKSTLLETVAGVDRPSVGAALLDGQRVHGLGASRRAAGLAFLPQQPRRDLALTVRDVVGLGRLRLAPSTDALESSVDAMGLETLLDRPVQTLSMGQAHRAHIARVLAQAHGGGVLVLDEPTAALDPSWSARTWTLLRTHADAGGVVLVAVHDVAVAADRADDAWILADGRLHGAGPAAEVLKPASLIEVFGAPFERVSRSDGSPWLVPGPDPQDRRGDVH